MFNIHNPAAFVDAKGAVVLDRRKYGENAFFLHAFDNPLAVAVGTPKPTVFHNPKDGGGDGAAGDMEVRDLVAWGNVPFLVSLKELNGAGGLDLQNNPIHHGFVFGTAERPIPLPEPIYLPAGMALQATCQNLSTALAASLKLAARGRKFNVELPGQYREAVAAGFEARQAKPFWLTLDDTTVTLTAGQSRVQKYLTMPAGWHFIARKIMVESTGPFSFDIYDHQTGRRLTWDGPIDSRLVAVPGGVDVQLPQPLVLEPNQKLRIEFTDLSSLTNVIYLTFTGPIVRNAR